MAKKTDQKPLFKRPSHKPQMEISLGMHGAPLKKVAATMAVAVMFLAVFNSAGLVDWSMKLPVGPVGDSVVQAAQEWNDLMGKIGATKLHDVLRAGFRWFQSL